MSGFLEIEKRRQILFKATWPQFSPAARAHGVYKNRGRPFCLPRQCALENLFPEIRNSSATYFAAQKIEWHDGQEGLPSNHLCDSQVCCTNSLFPFADKPEALAALLSPVCPNIRCMLPIEGGQFFAMEWIGKENYLHERMGTQGQRTRGANFTSADAAIMFQRSDKLRQILLIEWKYTESYPSTSIKIARGSGTDRSAIYRPLFDRDDCPLDKNLLPAFDDLFYEPFYQFMRQQFLAHEMEKAHELGADVVSVLHIAPAHNVDFPKITSPRLRPLGTSATGVWRKLVRTPERFVSISTEELFGHFPIRRFPELQAWWEYITTRYGWMVEKTTGVTAITRDGRGSCSW